MNAPISAPSTSAPSGNGKRPASMRHLAYGVALLALLLGFTGMLSFGHAAYLGWSAYVTGWLVTQQGWGPGSGILAGTLASALLGLVIGAIAIRRQGIYFAM